MSSCPVPVPQFLDRVMNYNYVLVGDERNSFVSVESNHIGFDDVKFSQFIGVVVHVILAMVKVPLLTDIISILMKAKNWRLALAHVFLDLFAIVTQFLTVKGSNM